MSCVLRPPPSRRPPADHRAGAVPMRTVLLVAALLAPPHAAARAATDADIEELIGRLADDDFAVRETAAERLEAIGADAADALMAAAESTTDLEVALRARWLVESLPLVAADDPPDVVAELERFAKAEFEVRERIMRRLLRLDGDAGITPLARLVRQERTPEGSRLAAALLAGEWAADDPFWPDVSRRIAAGIGHSRRPAARFLRGLVTATGPDPANRAAAVDEAVAAFEVLARPTAEAAAADPLVAADPDDSWIRDLDVRQTLRRCMIQLLAAAGREADAVAEAGRLFAAFDDLAVADLLVARDVAWLADRGLGAAADLLDERLANAATDPRLLYAAAFAWRTRSDPGAAERTRELAERARAAVARVQDFEARRRTAAALASWGAIDWAVTEYLAVLDAAEAPAGDFALAGIGCAEFLHDHGRDAEAADILRRVVSGRPGRADDMDHVLIQEGIDPKSKRSRMHYFAACAAAARGDAAGQRRLVEEALREDRRDVDALIAAYALAGTERDAVTAKVSGALASIEDQINAVPNDPSAYNEYAWLVANTTGDLRKATLFSRRSLEILFDTAAYLDTFAHCRAAAGDKAGAVRTQWLAVRQEPHSPTLRRNLERFKKAAAP